MTRRNKKRLLMMLDAIIALGVVLAVILALVLLNQLKLQARNNHDDQVKATQTLEDDMQCLGAFFSYPSKDRANLRISSLRHCTIENTSTGQTQNIDIKGSTSISIPNPSAPQTVAMPTPTTAQPPKMSSPAGNTPASSGTSGTAGAQPTVNPQPGVVQSIIDSVKALPQTLTKIL
jgi:hypothetical protein